MGAHTVDRFANCYNTQLPHFNSRFWNPGAEAVDAFTCDWGKDNNWFCPQVYLIPRIIMHGRQYCAVGTLLAPEWPLAPFWLILYRDGKYQHPLLQMWWFCLNTKSYSTLVGQEHACSKALQIQIWSQSGWTLGRPQLRWSHVTSKQGLTVNLKKL